MCVCTKFSTPGRSATAVLECRSTPIVLSSPTPAPTRLQDTITLWLFGIFENQTYRRNVERNVERLLLLEHASRTIHDRPRVGTALPSSFTKI